MGIFPVRAIALFRYYGKYLVAVVIIGIIAVVSAMMSCTQESDPQGTGAPDTTELQMAVFPDFITKNEDYFVTRIDGIPTVEPESFRLEITGLIETLKSSSLAELPPRCQKVSGGAPDGDPGIRPREIHYWEHRPSWHVQPGGIENR